MPARSKSATLKDSVATISCEAKLWFAVDELCNNMNAAEPSGARQTAAASPNDDRGGANQCKAENVFWVAADARWYHCHANVTQPTIGKSVDDATCAVERDDPFIKCVLPNDYARPGLGEYNGVIATFSLTPASKGEKIRRPGDLRGHVYDDFLTRYASAEGKNGGHASGERKTAKGSPTGERGCVHQFYTPSCAASSSYECRIYDPACGSGGKLPASRLVGVLLAKMDSAIEGSAAQSERFVASFGGELGDISIYGQGKWPRRQRPFGLATRARKVRLRRQQPNKSNGTTPPQHAICSPK
ncbi:MAG: Type restriction enzyme EcoKI protein [Verrucomicrobiota bacterium]|jgi:type I restriction enzyme M protein